jgi:hypothetical protein
MQWFRKYTQVPKVVKKYTGPIDVHKKEDRSLDQNTHRFKIPQNKHYLIFYRTTPVFLFLPTSTTNRLHAPNRTALSGFPPFHYILCISVSSCPFTLKYGPFDPHDKATDTGLVLQVPGPCNSSSLLLVFS